jgi:uncharacterized protein (TIGR02271 family)
MDAIRPAASRNGAARSGFQFPEKAMAAKKKNDDHAPKKKTVDLPPKGARNADPITDAPGAHPIETGVGAGLGGAAAGLAIGAVGGPIGAVIGGIVGGAVAGGLAGKGVGELIDPTTEDTWLREYFGSTKHKRGDSHEHYRDAYRYGLSSADTYHDRRFEDVEPDLRTGWEKNRGTSTLAWDDARDAVRHAFDRTVQLREEKLRVSKTPVRTGDVKVRKEVHTDHKTVTVPVEREEIVIERRPASGHATGDVKAEEIRIPVKEEQVHVSKETVVKEEVRVGKRKVHDTEEVSDDVRREELVVETEGKAKVRHQNHGHKA